MAYCSDVFVADPLFVEMLVEGKFAAKKQEQLKSISSHKIFILPVFIKDAESWRIFYFYTNNMQLGQYDSKGMKLSEQKVDTLLQFLTKVCSRMAFLNMQSD